MLAQIAAYAEEHLSASEPGFRAREVRWAAALDATGAFLDLLPLGDGKRGESLTRCPDMHNMKAGGRAHFLVEACQFAALLTKGDAEVDAKQQARHDFFVMLMCAAAKQLPTLMPVANLLQDPAALAALRQALSNEKAKPTDWLTWQLAGSDPRDDQTVQAWWRDWRRVDLADNAQSDDASRKATASPMLCMLTGTPGPPLMAQPPISGLAGVGGLAMGDVMVGFDKAAFTSYGLQQSANAAMSAAAVQRYVDGLNDLVRNHSHKLANALVVHWFKDAVRDDEDLLGWLDDLESEDVGTASAGRRARGLLTAIRTGKRPDLARNRYYALTLSGAGGRVMVRDWMEGGFEELAEHIAAWFDDLAIVDRDGRGLARDPKFLAVGGALVRELKDLPAPAAAMLWRVALLGLPIPQAIMAQALARVRVDVIEPKKSRLDHLYARMGLLRAYYVRTTARGACPMTTHLNPDHPDAAYHCGRLLALFANLQRAALGDVGAGVVQRYYAAASQTPGLMLGRLVNNSRNHLGKLEQNRPKLAWWFDNQLAEVMGRLGDRAPRMLDLEGQGLFALGYYQQLAALRAGNKGETDAALTTAVTAEQ